MSVSTWNFNAEEYEEQVFSLIPIGNYRVRVSDIQERKSKNGNDMLEITMDVSGVKAKLWYYLVFMPDNTKMTNQNIGAFCNSFGINPPSVNGILASKGKVGACRVKHTEYMGDKQASIAYLLPKSKQDDLPPWVEPGDGEQMFPVKADEVPFPDEIPF